MLKNGQPIFNNMNESLFCKKKYSVKELFFKEGFLKNFAKFTGKHLRQSLFSNKIASACNFIKRDSGTSVFLWILPNLLGTLFFRTPLVTASA